MKRPGLWLYQCRCQGNGEAVAQAQGRCECGGHLAASVGHFGGGKMAKKRFYFVMKQ